MADAAANESQIASDNAGMLSIFSNHNWHHNIIHTHLGATSEINPSTCMVS